MANEKAITLDGVPIEIAANIGNTADALEAVKMGRMLLVCCGQNFYSSTVPNLLLRKRI